MKRRDKKLADRQRVCRHGFLKRLHQPPLYLRRACRIGEPRQMPRSARASGAVMGVGAAGTEHARSGEVDSRKPARGGRRLERCAVQSAKPGQTTRPRRRAARGSFSSIGGFRFEGVLCSKTSAHARAERRPLHYVFDQRDAGEHDQCVAWPGKGRLADRSVLCGILSPRGGPHTCVRQYARRHRRVARCVLRQRSCPAHGRKAH